MDPPIPVYKPSTGTVIAWAILGLVGVALLILTVYGYVKSSSWYITYRVESSDVVTAGLKLPFDLKWWYLILIAIPIALLLIYWGRDLLHTVAASVVLLVTRFCEESMPLFKRSHGRGRPQC
jgi:hypothetical protein